MLALWSGLAAGGLHAVSGPDHLAALGPIALRVPARALRVGATWGAGHGVGLLLLAALVYGAQWALPLSALAWASELAVGLLLIAMGAWHGLGSPRPAHPHSPLPGGAAAFGMGMLHGGTGASHLVGVLPGLGLGHLGAAAYLLSYVAAAALAMSVVGGLLGSLARRVGPRAMERLRRGVGLCAVLVGVLWVMRSIA